MLEDFITIETISTFPGMVLVVSLMTQFTKTLIDRFFKNHTQYVVYFYALILNLFISYTQNFEGDLLTIIIMNVLNSIIVALAAMKAYEKVVSNKKNNSKDKGGEL